MKRLGAGLQKTGEHTDFAEEAEDAPTYRLFSSKKEKKKVKRSKAMRPKTARKHLAEKGIQPENYDKALIECLEKGDCKTAAALIHAGAAINASGDEKKPLSAGGRTLHP